MSQLFSVLILITIFVINLNIKNFTTPSYGGRLVCVSNASQFVAFGNKSQLADLFWMRFLQETDAFNELKIAKQHLCSDEVSSWHYHILNVAIDLDHQFYELMAMGPLFVSVLISDSIGSSKLFDKAVEHFPNDGRILFQAAYQALIEEKNYKKAASLFVRAGDNGAPRWVYSLAGGLYSESGMKEYAEGIYKDLVSRFPDDNVTKRLKSKLDAKVRNFYVK